MEAKNHVEIGTGACEYFSELYPMLNKDLLKHGIQTNSRNGHTYEVLNQKTIITNPVARCVGGYDRDINIFFLLMEAMWIWAGKNDVETLAVFNSNMKDYSDNGSTFHGAYGARMRKWGEMGNLSDSSKHAIGIDQIAEVVMELNANPNSRRAVISIWNPETDLAVDSKDIPCNDMLMFKVRNNKLYTTIQNRSNDLHWGLPTNVFQFSFVSELIALLLGVEVGEQVHNSQSLHIYTELKKQNIHKRMMHSQYSEHLYDFIEADKMDFDFIDNIDELHQIDWTIKTAISAVFYDDTWVEKKGTIFKKSKSLWNIVLILRIYLKYKSTERTEADKKEAMYSIFVAIYKHPDDIKHYDYWILALNWFARRIKDKSCIETYGKGILKPSILNKIGKL